jgi:hypothetical protein
MAYGTGACRVSVFSGPVRVYGPWVMAFFLTGLRDGVHAMISLTNQAMEMKNEWFLPRLATDVIPEGTATNL